MTQTQQIPAHFLKTYAKNVYKKNELTFGLREKSSIKPSL